MTPSSRKNLLLYAASDIDADVLYATRFFAPDPFVYIRTARGRNIMVMSDLEIDRARKESTADTVLALSTFVERARRRSRGMPHAAAVIAEVLRELGIRGVTVPERFPAGIADGLRRRRIRVSTAPDPFFPARQYKTDEEIREIRRVMRVTESGMRAGLDVLRSSRIVGNRLMYERRALTAERLRSVINEVIFARGCVPMYTIVAPGRHGCDPHDRGSGPIRPHQPVIVDVFPRSESSGYFGDMTRTFVRGRADERIKRMYKAVLDAQRVALSTIRHGVRARDVHEAVQGLFGSRGFESGVIDGRMQGFFHGTGHGIGLEIHERPRVSRGPDILEKNMVVTVEPGLYYWPHGGVRIEDTVLVTRDGIRNLTRFPKYLEIP